MTVYFLIVVLAGIPMGAKYQTREACEDAALRVSIATAQVMDVWAKVECVERKR